MDPVKIEIVLRWERPTTTIVSWDYLEMTGVYTWFLFFGGHYHTTDKEGGERSCGPIHVRKIFEL